MADDALVRNSRILGTFMSIVLGPAGHLRAVEIAGRGIAAEVRATLAMAQSKSVNPSGSPQSGMEEALAYADHLMDLGVIEDDLAESWRGRRAGEIDDAAFEAALAEIVARLESWPQFLTAPTD
jgi:hypothetical protein